MRMATRKFSLTFGLVSIPVRIQNATKEQKVSFHQITPCCGARVGQDLRCKSCGQQVSRAEVKKGYEISKDNYVVLERAEVEAVKLPSVKTIEVVGFIPADSLDPITFAETYYIAPEEGGEKGYSLLLEALRELGRIAIGRLTMNGKEHTVAISSRKGLLLLTLLWYPNEIVAPPEVGLVPISERELELAKQLLKAMDGVDFREFKDRYVEALKELIKAKLEGKEVRPVEVEVQATSDIQKALEESVKRRLAVAEAR
jgi:DNA end-binding protein Ku